MSSTLLLTRNGNLLDLNRPNPDLILVSDIATALSRIPRYIGHTRAPYSVAEHCVHVARLLPEQLKLHGLLHDAAEAYIGDIPTPVKEYLRERDSDFAVIDDLEDRWMQAVYDGLDLERPTPLEAHVIKYADLVMLSTELRDLHHPLPEEYARSVRHPAPSSEIKVSQPWCEQRARGEWLAAFDELTA